MKPTLIILIMASLVTSAAQIIMRWGGRRTATALAPANLVQWLWVSRWWLGGIMLSWLGGIVYAWTLRRMNLNLAMPVYSGLVYLLSSLAGFWLLRESLSSIQIAGVFVILAGLLMLTVH